MSNIYTSYIRIKRRDNNRISSSEIDYLFSEIVKVHDNFGSYWVRIIKKNRERENCLDIQFGSGKRNNNILNNIDIFDKYLIFERLNYENSIDVIFEYQEKTQSNGQKYVMATEPRQCKYSFNKIITTSETNWLVNDGAEQISSNQQMIKINGSYYSSNCKAFVDLYDDSAFYGPSLGYDEEYPYDYFVLTKSELVKFQSPSFLESIYANNFDYMPNDSKMEFLNNDRIVLRIEKYYDSIRIFSSDYWDNCIDEQFLETK